MNPLDFDEDFPGKATTTYRADRVLYALRSDQGHFAIIAVNEGDDPWIDGVRYVRHYLPSNAFLADLAPATATDIERARAEGRHVPRGQLQGKKQ